MSGLRCGGAIQEAVMGALSRCLARVPLAAMALGCFAGVLCAEFGGPTAGALVPAALLAGCVAMRRWRLAAGCAAWALLWAAHAPRLERQENAEAWVLRNGRLEAEIDGVVLSLRDREGYLPRALFRIDGSAGNPPALRRAVVAVRDLPDEVKPGDRLRLRGRMFVPAGARNPGEFDLREWMRTRGIAAGMQADAHLIVARPDVRLALYRFAWDLRLELRERIVRGLDETSAPASLIRGLVLGDRSTGGEEVYGAFRKSGTLHVFAVSGLHVGLVGALSWYLMKLLRVPRGRGLWVVLVLMWGYAFVTGLRPPALRASLMGSVFLLGFAAKRQSAMANSLLASLPIVLLLDSYQLRQAGFQLSYAVVGTIIVLAPPIYRRLQPAVEGDPFLPRLLYTRPQKWALGARRKVAGLFAVSLAAWIGSVPLIGGHFGIVTPVAVLASMILIPVVFAILAIALLGAVVGWVAEPLATNANRANGLLAQGAFVLAQEFSELPGSHFELRGRGGWPSGILVFDLWDGDGAIFCGAGQGTLIDGGAEDQFRRVVHPALREAGCAPHSLVLTHPDGGHAGGLAAALETLEVGQVLLPVREGGSPAFRSLVQRAVAAGIPLHFAATGERYLLGDGAELEILRVAPGHGGGIADNRGMILRLHWRGWRILISGDAGFETEKELLARGTDLRCNLWIMGRHRSDFTGTLEFVQAVRPRVIVAADETYPLGERVPDWWAAAVRKLGIDLWSQRSTGAVMIEVTNDELRLRSFLGDRDVRLRKGSGEAE